MKKMSENKTSIPGIMISGCDTIMGNSHCQPCKGTCIALRLKPIVDQAHLFTEENVKREPRRF